jgi:hypothetical protein
MVNLNEAEEIRAPLRSFEASEQEVSHRCRFAVFITQEDVIRFCRKRACRKTGTRKGWCSSPAVAGLSRCSPRFSTHAVNGVGRNIRICEQLTISSSLELEIHPCEYEARFDSGRETART